MGGLLRQRLEEQNHTVTLARDGLEGIHAAETCDFDAIVLDVMMPGMDGVEVARRLRSTGRQTPILRAANPYSDVDRAGLCRRRSARPGWGADDYLTKTFSFRVLLARLRAISRRAIRPPLSTLHVDDLALDPATREVSRAGRPLTLTATAAPVLDTDNTN